MTLSDFDRKLLARLQAGDPGAWRDFVDRFASLIVLVLDHLQESWSVALTPQARDAVFRDVFQAIREDDLLVLRQHDGQSSLATYLTVVVRRVAGQKMLQSRD